MNWRMCWAPRSPSSVSHPGKPNGSESANGFYCKGIAGFRILPDEKGIYLCCAFKNPGGLAPRGLSHLAIASCNPINQIRSRPNTRHCFIPPLRKNIWIDQRRSVTIHCDCSEPSISRLRFWIVHGRERDGGAAGRIGSRSV